MTENGIHVIYAPGSENVLYVHDMVETARREMMHGATLVVSSATRRPYMARLSSITSEDQVAPKRLLSMTVSACELEATPGAQVLS